VINASQNVGSAGLKDLTLNVLQALNFDIMNKLCIKMAFTFYALCCAENKLKGTFAQCFAKHSFSYLACQCKPANCGASTHSLVLSTFELPTIVLIIFCVTS